MFDPAKIESTKVEGVVTLKYTDEDAFKAGTEISFKTLKEVEEYQHTYVDKATEFITEEAKKVMEEDSKVSRVVATLPYSTSKRGAVDIIVDRSKTYPGINGTAPVTKSKITVKVTAPQLKLSGSKIRGMEDELTKTLLS